MLAVIMVNTAANQPIRTQVSLRLIVAVQTHVHRRSRSNISLFRTTKRPPLMLNTNMWPGAITVVSYGNIASRLLSAQGPLQINNKEQTCDE